MSYERIKEIEKYFMKKSTQTPDDIKIAKTHLLILANEMSEEDLKDAKIYYQSQLSASGMIGNYLTIMAILISIFACLITLISSLSDPLEPLFKYFIGFLVLLVSAFTVLAHKMHKHLKTSTRLHITYTIIINLIDEVIQK